MESILNCISSGESSYQCYIRTSTGRVSDQINHEFSAIADLILGVKSANVSNLSNHIIRARPAAHPRFKIPQTETLLG